MKLRTKFQDEYFNLEEVADVDIATTPDGRIKAQAKAKRGGLHTIFYKTKAEFDADWEDAPEEPKEYWYVSEQATVVKMAINPDDVPNFVESCSSIGNLFKTKEEAEKAVKKLEAWKRLKDKGFRFKGWTIPEKPKTPHIKLVIEAEMDVPDSPHDLDLLFGGGKNGQNNER